MRAPTIDEVQAAQLKADGACGELFWLPWPPEPPEPPAMPPNPPSCGPILHLLNPFGLGARRSRREALNG